MRRWVSVVAAVHVRDNVSVTMQELEEAPRHLLQDGERCVSLHVCHQLQNLSAGSGCWRMSQSVSYRVRDPGWSTLVAVSVMHRWTLFQSEVVVDGPPGRRAALRVFLG